MRHKNILSHFAIRKRFAHVKPRSEQKFQWIQPTGFQTDINVYNPVAKCKTPLVVRNKHFLTWYMCGPTLYDSAHLGHACTYVRFDIIKRILTDVFNLDVVQIMGLTDIDDKIIKKSHDTKQEWRQITQFYEREFFEDVESLNVLRPYHSCRVTDYIPQIVEFVRKIINSNHAYVAQSGSVYFDTLKYQNYGKLSLPETNTETYDPEKKSALDFALWKSAKSNEPFWESPWGKGRPGWHIECSAIASHIFGRGIDIHSGGIDLAFPHHENEEAQSCCYHDEEQWINYWMHTGHLYLKDNEKMSKSLQNTISIQQFLSNFSANEFRMMCLLTNYRNGIEYSETVIEKAVTILNKIEHFLQNCNDYVSGKLCCGVIDEPKLLAMLDETRKKVIDALKDDFNTGKVMLDIIELIKMTNKMFNEKDTKIVARSTVAVAAVSKYISSILTKFGVTSLQSVKTSEQNVNGIVDSYVNFRSVVRTKVLSQAVKDIDLLQACDTARKDLSVYGIFVKDSKQTSTWTFVEKTNQRKEK